MKKRSIPALLGVLALLALAAGCGPGGPAAAETAPIGIIGAMDAEVASLKEAADITETREIAAMTFCIFISPMIFLPFIRYGRGSCPGVPYLLSYFCLHSGEQKCFQGSSAFPIFTPGAYQKSRPHCQYVSCERILPLAQ